jgi:hypothetical protein
LSKTPTPLSLSGTQLKHKSSEMFQCVKLLCESGFYGQVKADVGLVIEYALKAMICKTLNCSVYPFPPNRSYCTHDLNDLIQKAGLQNALQNQLTGNNDFFINWSLISAWSSEYKYLPVGCTSKAEAEEMINALEHPQNGVYIWIQKIW